MFGTELPPGTHADALVHYTRAAELNPRRLAHRRGRSPRATPCMQRCKVLHWQDTGECSGKLRAPERV